MRIDPENKWVRIGALVVLGASLVFGHATDADAVGQQGISSAP